MAAKLERLSELLTSRFFPNQDFIEEKQACLELMTRGWIQEKGSPGCCTAPLRYGQAYIIAAPGKDGIPVQCASHLVFQGNEILSLQKNPPLPSRPDSLVRLESLEGSRRAKAAILAGDKVRVRLIGSGSYLSRGLAYVKNVAEAATLTLLHYGDDTKSPSRLGEYFTEKDTIGFMVGEPGNPQGWLTFEAGPRYLFVGLSTNAAEIWHPGFCLPPCDEPEAQT